MHWQILARCRLSSSIMRCTTQQLITPASLKLQLWHFIFLYRKLKYTDTYLSQVWFSFPFKGWTVPKLFKMHLYLSLCPASHLFFERFVFVMDDGILWFVHKNLKLLQLEKPIGNKLGCFATRFNSISISSNTNRYLPTTLYYTLLKINFDRTLKWLLHKSKIHLSYHDYQFFYIMPICFSCTATQVYIYN